MAGADWAVAARLGHGRVQSVLSAGDEGERDGVGGRGRAAAQARRRLSACRWAASSDCPVILPPLDELPEAGRPAGMPMAGRASALCAIGWTVGAATKTQGPRCGRQASSACFHVSALPCSLLFGRQCVLFDPASARGARHPMPYHGMQSGCLQLKLDQSCASPSSSVLCVCQNGSCRRSRCRHSAAHHHTHPPSLPAHHSRPRHPPGRCRDSAAGHQQRGSVCPIGICYIEPSQRLTSLP